MKRSQVLTALMIHTVVSIDTQGVLISHQSRREADRLLEGDQVGTPSESIVNRAQHLLLALKERAPLLVSLTQALNIFGTSSLLIISTLSLCLGFGVHSAGEGRYFHLLSPVLLGLLLWNGLSIPLILWNTIRTSKTSETKESQEQEDQQQLNLKNTWQSSLIWIQQKWFQFVLRSINHGALQQEIINTFTSKALGLTQHQLIAEFRRALHLMSIAFTTGVLCSIYWDGLVHKYLASAESTFLNQSQLETLLSFILWPSIFFDYGPISLTQFTYDQRHQFLVSAAAPWIHKYTISLGFWIILPRIGLVLLDSVIIWRSNLTLPFKLSWFEQVPTLNIALASHTNIGKTSLARTLLKRDVGIVEDLEHITRAKSSYFLINNSEVRIRLWDTPGFGTLSSQDPSLSTKPSHQLEVQLEKEAIHALKTEADIILYLVPAWPSQQQVQQTHQELDVLSNLNKPILIVINRIHHPSEPLHPEASQALKQEDLKHSSFTLWQGLLNQSIEPQYKRQIIVLDAFERLFKDEYDFFQALIKLSPQDKIKMSQRALRAWETNYQTLIEALSNHVFLSIEQLLLLKAAVPSKAKKYRNAGIEELNRKTERVLKTSFNNILDCLGLDGNLRSDILHFSLETSISKVKKSDRRKWGAIVGGALSGLSTGLAADIMSGGLTLGGGLIIGTLLGAAGGVGVVEGYEFLTDSEQELYLSSKAIYALSKQMILFTLAASQHGRAQGAFEGHDEVTILNPEIETIRTQCVIAMDQLEKKYQRSLMHNFETMRFQGDLHQNSNTSGLISIITQIFTEGFKLL